MRPGFAIISGLMAGFIGATIAWGQGTVPVAVPAKAGTVEGTTENSDAFIWRLFTEFVYSKPGRRMIIPFQAGLIGLSRGNE
jgi:hypothetical protein